MMICMSPLNNQFWYRIQQFPALINCCTIDWFLKWPTEALVSVAKDSLEIFSEENHLDNPVSKFVDFFQYAHKLIETEAENFRREENRHFYVTPSSYLQLISKFKDIYLIKLKENHLDI